jgi:hypothetical protein
MIRNFKFKLPMLPYEVHILTGQDMIRHYALHHEIEGMESIQALMYGRSLGCVQPCGGSINYILMLPEEYDPITVGHECLHLANMMWDRCGARLTTDNDEVIAYTCDYIHEYIQKVCYVSKK